MSAGRSSNHSEHHRSAGVDDIDAGVENATLLLVGLAKRTVADPTAPFVPSVLSELLALKKADRGAFEKLRADLKAAGCRVPALDEAISLLGGGQSFRRPTQSDKLITIAKDAVLFHTADGTAYADIEVANHRETWPVRTKGFRRWLTRRYFEEFDGAPGTEALQSAISVIEAKAHYGAPQMKIHLRVGEVGGRLYLDLADPDWRAIEIDTAGWRIIDKPPIRFRRTSGMLPLPEPISGGSISILREFLNLQSDADFALVVAWVLACLRHVGPYPVLALSGEQGSAKSTFAATLRSLVDPNTTPLRALPREDRDLFIAANNGHLLAFDNVSNLPPWLSDTLCRLATGGGFAVRQLYTDQDEILFDATRPIILNGIEDIVTRQDLADRTIFLNLAPIPEERRRAEADLKRAFEAAQPKLLGVLLDAVAEGLRRLPSTRLERLPRMADFAIWATACETALWSAGTFCDAYQGNREEAVDNVLEADPVALAIRQLMSTREGWCGTATQLLGVLAEIAGEKVAKTKGWPETARLLSGRITRAAPFLRRVGINIKRDKTGHTRTRTISINTAPREPEPEGNSTPASSAPSAGLMEPTETAAFGPSSLRTMNDNAGDEQCSGSDSFVRNETTETRAADDADDADDDCTSCSNLWSKTDKPWEETI